MTNPETLYWGLAKIANRLGVSKNLARAWCNSGVIRAKRSKKGNQCWFTNESSIAEDIKQLPGKEI
jgi:predicted site-specific integrase-resolvase